MPIGSFLRYDWSGTVLAKNGLGHDAIERIAADLEKARHEVLETDLRIFHSRDEVPPEKRPLDAGFVEMPQRLLEEFDRSRDASELAHILATAARLRETVDRVVVLGIGGSYMGARALMEACCHPYHNELNRAARGTRPRLYFDGNNVDNDASSGLLDLLASSSNKTAEDRWAIVVISKSGGTLETAVALRQFLAALKNQCRQHGVPLADLVVPVTGKTGRLHELAKAIGCTESFRVPDGVGGRFSVLSAVGLLPAAVLGLDIVKLLKGAAEMNSHFGSRPPGKNVVLDYVGVCHLMEKEWGVNLRVLSAWSQSLESVGLWYDQLFAESLGKDQKGATPLTVVNTRDLHSRAQQHQEGPRDKLFTNLIVDQWKRDPLRVGHSQWDQDGLNQIADRGLPEIMTAAIDGTNRAYRDVDRPTANIHLPMVDETSMGQLLQMMMLATVVEGRLIGVNPYGQPGVEAYKRYMKANLKMG